MLLKAAARRPGVSQQHGRLGYSRFNIHTTGGPTDRVYRSIGPKLDVLDTGLFSGRDCYRIRAATSQIGMVTGDGL